MNGSASARAAAPDPVQPVSPAPPSGAPAGWLARAGERLNPIIVKEVRQGLRTKVFWVCFGLMLLACVVIALIAFGTRDVVSNGGPRYFTAFFACLALVNFFVIPYSAYRSMAREREEETWVLLTLTGLGPRAILRGKLGSYLVQAALYASAAGPFLVFSYYLNGIDLPTILLILALGAAFVVFLTSVMVSAATLAERRLFRAFTHLVVLGALLVATSTAISIGGFLADDGSSILGQDELPYALGFVACLMGGYGVLLFEAAAARLALPTEPYARGPRLAFLGQLAVTALAFVLLWIHEHHDEDIIAVAQVTFCLHIGVVGFPLASDADGLARCHRAGLTPLSLLRPGALRGYRLVLIALAATSALWLGLYAKSSGPGENDLRALASGPMYLALYLSIPLALRMLMRGRGASGPVVSRLVFLGLIVAGSGLPPLIAVMLGLRDAQPAVNLFNPVIGPVNFSEGRLDGSALLLVGTVAAGMVLLTDRLLAAREAEALRAASEPRG